MMFCVFYLPFFMSFEFFFVVEYVVSTKELVVCFGTLQHNAGSKQNPQNLEYLILCN